MDLLACWGDNRGDLADDDVITTDLYSWTDDAVLVELVIGRVSHTGCLRLVGYAEVLVVLPGVIIRPVED